jgi:WD40 repeat protein
LFGDFSNGKFGEEVKRLCESPKDDVLRDWILSKFALTIGKSIVRRPLRQSAEPVPLLTDLSAQIVHFLVGGTSLPNLEVVAILRDNKVIRKTRSSLRAVSLLWLPCDVRCVISAFDSKKFGSVLFYASGNTLSSFDLREKKLIKYETTFHCEDICCLRFGEQCFISGSNDGSVALWLFTRDIITPVEFVAVHKGGVTDICVSTNLGIVVSCASDDSLVVMMLNGLKYVRSIWLNMSKNGDSPRRVVVCDNSAMIVVFGLRFIESFSVNGSCVMSIDFGCSIRGAVSFLNGNYCDVLGVVDECGNLWIVDEISLERKRRIEFEKVWNIFYRQTWLVVETEDGVLFLLDSDDL